MLSSPAASRLQTEQFSVLEIMKPISPLERKLTSDRVEVREAE